MADVVSKMGSPHHIKSQARTEVWQYNYNKDRTVFVYFQEGSLQDVKLSQDLP